MHKHLPMNFEKNCKINPFKGRYFHTVLIEYAKAYANYRNFLDIPTQCS
jgi:hypothetical protein